jgi:hypothetical protein
MRNGDRTSEVWYRCLIAPILAVPGQSVPSRKRPFVPITRLLPYGDRRAAPDKVASSRISPEPDTEWFCCIGTALGRQKAEKFEDVSCRTSKVAGFSAAFCWTARAADRRPRRTKMFVSYSRYGVSTSSIHFMNARTRRDRLLRCATTRDTASARRRKSGMTSTSAPLSKYRPIPKSGA